jgi:hypothetical protein
MPFDSLRAAALALRDRLRGPARLRLVVRLRRRQDAILVATLGAGILYMMFYWR